MKPTDTAAAIIIRGQVMHERLRPVRHRFVYPVFYVRANLARLNELNSAWFGVNRWRFASLRTADHGARDGSDLQTWMRNLLQQAGVEADGEIWLQTFPRLFGFAFNPVSFWYCYDKSKALRAVMAEVNNTFGESHRYLMTAPDAITENTVLISQKNLHVSPFCQVLGHYRFQFRDTATTTLVNLDYHDDQDVLIKTAVGGQSEALTAKSVRRAVLRQPWLTLSIVIGIHSQALKLWCKRVPYFSKPAPPENYLSHSLTPEPRTNQKELRS